MLPSNSSGETVSLKDFLAGASNGTFLQKDGYAHPMKKGMIDQDRVIYPTQLSQLPKDATHVRWFSK